MRITLITPTYFPAVTGNAITVQRIAGGLRSRGAKVQVLSLEGAADREALWPQAEEFAPAILHGFHAHRTGPLATAWAERLGVPAVVSLTGTDVNHDLFDAERAEAVREALRRADAVVVFHEAVRDKLLGACPELGDKVRVIWQTVRCEETEFDLRARLGLSEAHCLFFLPAGIRRVKNVRFALRPLAALQARHPTLRLVLAGPAIEAEEATRLQAALADLPWAQYLGELEHEEVCESLEAVDVVLNTSISEGGMSNAVLEAMSKGRAVLASDIEGNRTIIRDGVDGCLFGSEEEFRAKAERLLVDPALRRRLGEAAQAKIARQFSPAREAEGYHGLYRDLLVQRQIG